MRIAKFLFLVAALSVSYWSVTVSARTVAFTDSRCGHMGANTNGDFPYSIPVAYPLVFPTGDNARSSAKELRDIFVKDLESSGVFRFLPRGVGPRAWYLAWNSPLAFDYQGWYRVGAYLVPWVAVSEHRGRVVASIRIFVTEEGDVLRLERPRVGVAKGSVRRLAHALVDALLECLTGKRGLFGTRIAYSKRLYPGGPKEIFVLEYGSAGEVQVTRDGNLAILPVWGPDGVLAFTGYRRGRPEVYVARQSGRAWSVRSLLGYIARQQMAGGFSPDGSILAVTIQARTNLDIFLVEARTGAVLKRLTHSSGVDTSPVFSGDGKKIVFVSDRGGGPQIYMMNADGSQQHPLPLPGSYNTSPDLSPDGTEVAYQSRLALGRFAVFVYDLRKGALRKLSSGAYNDEEPSWSPDGRFIVYTSTRDGRKRLFVMKADGSHPRALLPAGAPGEYFTPAWEK